MIVRKGKRSQINEHQQKQQQKTKESKIRHTLENASQEKSQERSVYILRKYLKNITMEIW